MQITKGKIKRADFILLYGTDGVGKTTFGAQMESPIFCGPEKGSEQLDVARFPEPKTMQDIMDQIVWLATQKHEFKSLVIDSLDRIEPMIWDFICKQEGVMSIEQVGGGFGKGYTYAIKVWDQFLALLNKLRDDKKINVLLIAHSQIKVFTDPATGSAYDRYQLKMNEKASALCRETVDSVLFATFKTYTKGKEGQKHKAFGDGTRVMYTERRPSHDAKNRFGLPFELPLNYIDYKNAVESDKTDSILSDINELKKNFDADLVKKIDESVLKAGRNAESLTLIRERLRTKQNEST